MNTKQIQFNRQWLASLLLAGVILAATAGQSWADVSPSQANWGTGSEKVDSAKHYNEFLSRRHRISINGGRGGLGGDCSY